MAVKPITNKQVVSSVNINRGKQVSTKDIKASTGNKKRSYNPNVNVSSNYAITLKDVDVSVMNHIKNVIRPKVREANETVDVAIMYGNEERWKAVRKRGVLRDKNGSIILPLIMLKRTAVERATELPPNMEHDVRREHAQVVRNTKWSKKNKYDRFSTQFDKNPLYEHIVTTVPNFVNVTYEFILWTSYVEQMNPLIETFVEQNYNYWGDSTNYKFLCTIDSIADASEMSVESERIIKSSFNLITKAYLLPEETNSVITNKISNLQKTLTPSRVVFGYEGDATNKQVGK